MFEKLNFFLKKNPSAIQVIIFLSVVLILFAIIVSSSLKIVQQRYQMTSLEDAIFELENENKLLVEKLETTSTESYIEDIARERLGMVRSDEIPVQITEKVEETQETKNNVIDSKEKAGMYLKEWYNQLGEWFKDAKKKG